jgi:hypothetical protein
LLDPAMTLILCLDLSTLSRRPAECAATQQVEVQMEDGLAGPCSVIDNGAVSRLLNCFFTSEPGGHVQKMPEQRFILGTHFRKRWNMLSRHHEHVHRSLGLNILNGNDALILIDNFGWYFPPNDLAKDAWILTHLAPFLNASPGNLPLD